MNNYTKFEQLRDSGLSPEEVSRIAFSDELDFTENLKMLGTVFSLDLIQAKELLLQITGIANTLDDYQEKLIPIIKDAMQEFEK